MNHLPKIASDRPSNQIHLTEAALAEAGVEPLEQPLGVDVTVRDVTGESSKESFFYSFWKRIFKSAYKFFSYVSYYLTSCFSQGSFRDVTNNAPVSANEDGAMSHGDSVVERAAAAIVKERQESQEMIHECVLHYSEHLEFYQKQEEFLKNYLEYLRDALNHLGKQFQKLHSTKLPLVKATKIAGATSYFLFDLINEIEGQLESLKVIPELVPLVTRGWNLLFKRKRENNETVQFPAHDLATMIKGKMEYFKEQQISHQILSRKVQALVGADLKLMVLFDPQTSSITKAEYVGQRIGPELITRGDHLPDIKLTAEHTRWSLLKYMHIFKQEIEEEVRLLDQEVDRLEGLARAQRAEETRKHYQAYRASTFRYKI